MSTGFSVVRAGVSLQQLRLAECSTADGSGVTQVHFLRSSPLCSRCSITSAFHSRPNSAIPHGTSSSRRRPIMNVAMQDSLPGMDGDGPVMEPREYPPGMQRYESMVILRPDLSEDERVAVIDRYEEALIVGGAVDVEMFNRGMQPLAYNIKTKSMGGIMSRYVDGIYLLFTYVTKPQSQVELQKRLTADDDVIRSTTFRLKT
eukprot:TRINITY_DN35777_c0_g1_i1.p1 TRINITY_DN35777_c0_g1~~TRINITY_DN35777_c0_g1_i1.p1  ORF type:complete len:203 (+),score=34.96 TRINITY_DN35777_c0_g1_i1:92-700(+)